MWMQNLLVALIVMAALLFALWRLPGLAMRRRYVRWLARLGGPGDNLLTRLAARLGARLDEAARAGGCAGCETGPSHRQGKRPS
jgi:hypothetical protein